MEKLCIACAEQGGCKCKRDDVWLDKAEEN